MRVAIFSESYEPIVNGVSVSVATLRDGLRARGHEVYVFAPHYPGHDDDEYTFRFPSRISRFAPGYPLPVPYAPELRDEFDRIAPDVVHTHTPFLMGLAGLRWAHRAGIPVVSTNHTRYTEYAHYLPWMPKFVTRSVLIRHMRWYYTHCDGVVVPSSVVGRELRGYGVENDITVIGSGIKPVTETPRPDAREQLGIPADAFAIMYAGRIAVEKNLGLLLKAFKIVRNRYPNVHLLLAGSGPYLDECRELAGTLGISEATTFAGMLSREQLNTAYRVSNLFAFPSMTETQGLVVCEALTAGLPCVAVKAGANPEVLEDGVDSILTQNSIRAFAKSVCSVVSDDGLRNRLSRGAIHNSARFSIDAMTDRFESLYESAVGKNRSKLVTVGG
jgi:glycosyltransferase involved in cell wall biosynthesis